MQWGGCGWVMRANACVSMMLRGVLSGWPSPLPGRGAARLALARQHSLLLCAACAWQLTAGLWTTRAAFGARAMRLQL